MKDVINSKEMQRVTATREMQPYNHPTRAMYIGAPGKVGYLRLGFELDKSGKSIMRDLQRMAPLIVQQELYCDEGMPAMPVVYILSFYFPCHHRRSHKDSRDERQLLGPMSEYCA